MPVLALIAAAPDLLQQVPNDPSWVPYGIGGAMLAAAIRFAFGQRREVSQDSGWKGLLEAAHQAAATAQAEAASQRAENDALRGELELSRRTLADTSEQLREAMIRNAELQAGTQRRGGDRK